MSVRKPSIPISAYEQPSVKVDKRVADKGFRTRRESNGMFSLIYTAGGETPNELKGYFTSAVKAERAAANYLANRNAASAS